MTLDFTGTEQALLTLLAGGIAIGIVVGLAGTPLYPLSYAMVLIALFWVATKDEAVIGSLTDFVKKTLGAGT